MATADNIENTDSITSPVRKETLTIQRIPQDTVTLWSKASKPIVPPSVYEQNCEPLVSVLVTHYSDNRVPQSRHRDISTLWSKVNKPIVPPSVHEQNSEALVMQCFSHTLVITGYLSQDTVTLVITEYLKTL